MFVGSRRRKSERRKVEKVGRGAVRFCRQQPFNLTGVQQQRRPRGMFAS
jgi:hypothetical protein